MCNMKQDVYESRFFDLSFRAVANEHDSVKIFMDRQMLEIDTQVSFDAEYAGVSSLDHFLSGLLGGILLALLEHAKHKRIRIEDLEGRLGAKLVNPFSLLRVRGCD